MYIARDSLEKALIRSVNGTMHSLLFGESGSGKTWLYKNVLSREGIKFRVANCARAPQLGSITEEIYSACGGGSPTKTEYSESKSAGVSALGTAEIAHEATYELQKPDRLMDAFKALGGSIKMRRQTSVIVLENVETLLNNQTFIDELSNIVILLDDERYALYKVKLLIVGVPNEVIQYFVSTKNTASVGNRIEEIPRVMGLTHLQVHSLLVKGFMNYLNIKINNTQFSDLVDHVFEVTLGVPQRIHEYCECLSYLLEDNRWEYIHTILDAADDQWMLKGLRESYSIICAHMNSDETSEGRRNQVLYCIGKIPQHQIDTNTIGEIIASEFPETAPDSRSGIGQVLSSLSKGEMPILKKIDKSNFYVVADPRIIMCIRIALFKSDSSENVKRRKFKIN